MQPMRSVVFLTYFHEIFFIKLERDIIEDLFNNGILNISYKDISEKRQKFLDEACKEYVQQLHLVFASEKNNFSNSDFKITLADNDISKSVEFNKIIGTSKKQIISIAKEKDSNSINIYLMIDKNSVDNPYDLTSKIIGEALRDILFYGIFPQPYIASAERTGAAIFRKDLNLERGRILEQIGSENKIDPFKIISGANLGYALPVLTNVSFARQIEAISKYEGELFKQHPDIFDDFKDIVGGEYSVGLHGELFFKPKGKKIKLTMDESSNGVRSLFDLGFYIRHVVNIGDLLVIEEPELNLHPEKQRKLARLLAKLVNHGIKIFITTHSDYIIMEFNTLIMLHSKNERIKNIIQRDEYNTEETLEKNDISVYIAKKALIKLDGATRRTSCQTLVPADINNHGIEIDSFDYTILEMNRIQDEILWGID